jgi:hypothetical protein
VRGRVQYAIAMASFFVVAVAATVAIRNTSDLSTTSHEVNHLVKRVAMDEHNTCVIQARGLPAGHQLAASMKVIYVLLTLPVAPGAAKTPPKIERLVLDLDSHLAAYLHAEAKQPPTRTCVQR